MMGNALNLATLTYTNYLKSHGLKKRLWGVARKQLIKLLHDPPCAMVIHNRVLTMPLSHALPEYLATYRWYDSLLARLSDFVHGEFGFLNCIDVGANIGDSIAGLYRRTSDRFLAIEPNPHFARYLTSNYQNDDNVIVLQRICSASSSTGAYEIAETRGTASIRPSQVGKQMNVTTVDAVVDEFSQFQRCNLLKIDTDGHDFDALHGASTLIATSLPTILFECEPHGNAQYVEDCLSTLRRLKGFGYASFILYDNFGYLIGRFPLDDDLHELRRLLFYQLISPFYFLTLS
jgi:FkbM family methyltransferase